MPKKCGTFFSCCSQLLWICACLLLILCLLALSLLLLSFFFWLSEQWPELVLYVLMSDTGWVHSACHLPPREQLCGCSGVALWMFRSASEPSSPSHQASPTSAGVISFLFPFALGNHINVMSKQKKDTLADLMEMFVRGKFCMNACLVAVVNAWSTTMSCSIWAYVDIIDFYCNYPHKWPLTFDTPFFTIGHDCIHTHIFPYGVNCKN